MRKASSRMAAISSQSTPFSSGASRNTPSQLENVPLADVGGLKNRSSGDAWCQVRGGCGVVAVGQKIMPPSPIAATQPRPRLWLSQAMRPGCDSIGRLRVGFGGDQFLLHTKWGRAPQRDPTIAVVVVVVVAEGPMIPNKEARLAVAQALVDPGQCENDLAHPNQFTGSHRASFAERPGRVGDPAPSRHRAARWPMCQRSRRSQDWPDPSQPEVPDQP